MFEKDATLIESLITFVGLACVIVSHYTIVRHVINGIRIHLLSKIGLGINLKSRYGRWAVVTGCTDGIGLAYSKELARRGLNLVLISRSQSKLENVAQQIKTEFRVETKIIQADFGKEGREMYKRIAENLKHIEIGILVNNVGVSTPYPMMFDEMQEDNLWDHIAVNVTAATMMTSLVLPDMKLRRKGAIVNVTSIASQSPFPLSNVYSATKKYLVQFSRGLKLECEGSGVTIQTLLPGFVNTKMVGFSKQLTKGGFFIPSVQTYAKSAVATLGVTDFTTGYVPHGLMFWGMRILPEWLLIKIQTKIMENLRKNYEKTNKSN